MSKCIVVMGMHRAGTSLMARILHEWGVCMGPGGIGKPDPANAEGEWENKEFVELNNQLLSSVGASWNYPKRVTASHSSWYCLAAKNLVRKNQKPVWGWKDNRTAFTFGCYKPFLKNPLIIVMRRGTGSIVESLCRTHLRQFREQDRNKGYLVQLIGQYYDEIDAVTSGMNRIDVHYEDLSRNGFFNPDLNHFK